MTCVGAGSVLVAPSPNFHEYDAIGPSMSEDVVPSNATDRSVGMLEKLAVGAELTNPNVPRS